MTFAKTTSAHVAERGAVGPRCERDDRVMARIAASRGELGCPEDESPRALVEARAAPGRTGAWARRPHDARRPRRLRRTQGAGPCRPRRLRAARPRGRRARIAVPRSRGRRGRRSGQPARAGREAARAAPFLRPPMRGGMLAGQGRRRPGAGIPATRHAKSGRGRLVPPRPPMTHMPRISHDTAASRHPQCGGHGLFWSLPEGRPTAHGPRVPSPREGAAGGGHAAWWPGQGAARP